MRQPDGQAAGEQESENNEGDFLLEGATMMLGRNLVLEKSPGIHKDSPS